MESVAVEKIMEFQQSPLYAKYITALKWQILTVGGVQMFYKNISLMGGLLKIQRPPALPPIKKLTKLIKEYNVKTIAIDPLEKQDMGSYRRWITALSKYCRVVRSGYMPTKTILVNLKPTEEEIFRRFSEAKRRAVRKAEKNGVIIRESNNIKDLIRIKNKSGGFLGFITTFGIDKFWNIMYPKHATILLAYHDTVIARNEVTRQSFYRLLRSARNDNTLIGGVLLVFWNKTAYYWIAGASKEGKKLFAPTLLVWEALRVAKKHGATKLDFLGVWDERKTKEHHDWKGFTRFKEGFGGNTLYYPVY